MKDTFDKQYNTSAKLFTELYDNLGAHISTDHFQRTVLEKVIPKTKEKKLIDFGCGPGTDFGFYINSGFDCSGLDISSGMVEVAKKKYPNLDIRNESFSKATSFKEKSFDLVVSKYAIQTIADIDLAYEEVSRLLIKNGYFAFLVVHPIRAFLEKKISGKDYFKKEIVESLIFNGKIKVHETTHTMKEYFSTFFFKNFSLELFEEGYDFPASEQVGGDIYPTYMIIVAKKK